MFPRPMRAVLLIIAVAAALSLGCKSPCRQLSEKLCECATSTAERENCLRGVQQRESNFEATDADQQVCQSLLDQCDCNEIDTPEGKRNCGLAR